MEQPRFEDLPRLVMELANEVRLLRMEQGKAGSGASLPQTLNIKQAAELAGRTPAAIRNHIYAGSLQAFMVGNRYRIDRGVFEKWLRGESDSGPKINNYKRK